MWRRWRVALAVILAALLAAATAAALSDGLWWYSPDAGSCMSGSGWRLCGSAGQPDAHVTPGLYGGYWHPIWTATPTVTPTPTASATPTASSTPTATATATPTPTGSPTPTTTASPATTPTPPGEAGTLSSGRALGIVRQVRLGQVAILLAWVAVLLARLTRMAVNEHRAR